MPICTHCSYPIQYLYTVYNTTSNLRLEQCPQCHEFADPYVEHDSLTLVLDLILLKRNVYRHLLFNRGVGVRKVGNTGSNNTPGGRARTDPQVSVFKHQDDMARTKARWIHIFKLAAVLITIDAFIRWTHLGVSQPFAPNKINIKSWNAEAVASFLRILIGCVIETFAFHAGATFSCFLLLKSLDWIREQRKGSHAAKSDVPNGIPPSPDPTQSGIRQEFRYSHVPLTLFYSSLTKLFLLFLLSVWRPDGTDSKSRPLPPQYNATNMFSNPIIVAALEILDEDRLDREWIVRNVLGGMAAGFGLRVVLDCHPAFTTMVVLAGWAVKTMVANLVSEWVMSGGDEQAVGEMWLAYSIP